MIVSHLHSMSAPLPNVLCGKGNENDTSLTNAASRCIIHDNSVLIIASEIRPLHD